MRSLATAILRCSPAVELRLRETLDPVFDRLNDPAVKADRTIQVVRVRVQAGVDMSASSSKESHATMDSVSNSKSSGALLSSDSPVAAPVSRSKSTSKSMSNSKSSGALLSSDSPVAAPVSRSKSTSKSISGDRMCMGPSLPGNASPKSPGDCKLWHTRGKGCAEPSVSPMGCGTENHWKETVRSTSTGTHHLSILLGSFK